VNETLNELTDQVVSWLAAALPFVPGAFGVLIFLILIDNRKSDPSESKTRERDHRK